MRKIPFSIGKNLTGFKNLDSVRFFVLSENSSKMNYRIYVKCSKCSEFHYLDEKDCFPVFRVIMEGHTSEEGEPVRARSASEAVEIFARNFNDDEQKIDIEVTVVNEGGQKKKMGCHSEMVMRYTVYDGVEIF